MFDYILDSTKKMKVEVLFEDDKHTLDVPCFILTLEGLHIYYDTCKDIFNKKTLKNDFNISKDICLEFAYT